MTLARRALITAPLALLAPRARAGAQVEEPLADAVRTALAASVADSAPPKPRFDTVQDRVAYLRWLGTASERLQPRKSERHTRIEFLEAVWYESRRAGLETALVLGLIQVESGFRKYAISSAGARGYMQVMPFWARVIGDGDDRQPGPRRLSEHGLRCTSGLGDHDYLKRTTVRATRAVRHQ